MISFIKDYYFYFFVFISLLLFATGYNYAYPVEVIPDEVAQLKNIYAMINSKSLSLQYASSYSVWTHYAYIIPVLIYWGVFYLFSDLVSILELKFYVMNNYQDVIPFVRLYTAIMFLISLVYIREVLKHLLNTLQANLKDIMSGYRVFNKKFIKNIPINSTGFEIETEMTLHALDKKFLLKEIPIEYRDRPEGSFSKLNTFSDGARVLKTIFWVFKDYKPLAFFTTLSFLFFILALVVGVPVVVEFLNTSLVTKMPSAVLSVGLMLVSIMSLFSGFILDTVVKQHQESYELHLNRFS